MSYKLLLGLILFAFILTSCSNNDETQANQSPEEKNALEEPKERYESYINNKQSIAYDLDKYDEWEELIYYKLERSNLHLGINKEKNKIIINIKDGTISAQTNDLETAKRECLVTSFVHGLAEYSQQTNFSSFFDDIQINTMRGTSSIEGGSEGNTVYSLNVKNKQCVFDYNNEVDEIYEKYACDIDFYYDKIMQLHEEKKLGYILSEKPLEYCAAMFVFDLQ